VSFQELLKSDYSFKYVVSHVIIGEYEMPETTLEEVDENQPEAETPVKEGDKIVMKTTKEVRQVLDKKDKQKSKEPEKQLELKIENNTIRDNFIKQIQKDIPGIEVVNKKTGRKSPNDVEPLIKLGKRNIMICAPSSQGWWSAYQFRADGKQIIRVTDENTQNQVKQWLMSRVQEFQQKKAKEKIEPKKSQKNDNKGRTVDELKTSILERMGNCKNRGISFPKEIKGNEKWFKDLAKKQGWTIDTKKRVLLNGQ